MFSFDQESHTYTLDGAILPSVTTLLKECGIISTAFYTDAGATNGSRRHLVTELLDRGNLDWSTVADEDIPYLEAWIKAKEDLSIEIEEIEKPMHHSIYGYAGMVDRLCTIGEENWVVDIKTGAKAKWNELQMILYGMMVSDFYGVGFPKMAIFNLKKNGRYEFSEVTYAQKNVAIAAVMIQKYKESK